MNTSILIPSALRAYADRQSTIAVEADDVAGALTALTTSYPGLARHLRDDAGKLRSFVNVYLGEDDVRHLPDGDRTKLPAGAVLTNVPSIAGGAR